MPAGERAAAGRARAGGRRRGAVEAVNALSSARAHAQQGTSSPSPSLQRAAGSLRMPARLGPHSFAFPGLWSSSAILARSLLAPPHLSPSAPRPSTSLHHPSAHPHHLPPSPQALSPPRLLPRPAASRLAAPPREAHRVHIPGASPLSRRLARLAPRASRVSASSRACELARRRLLLMLNFVIVMIVIVIFGV